MTPTAVCNLVTLKHGEREIGVFPMLVNAERLTLLITQFSEHIKYMRRDTDNAMLQVMMSNWLDQDIDDPMVAEAIVLSVMMVFAKLVPMDVLQSHRRWLLHVGDDSRLEFSCTDKRYYDIKANPLVEAAIRMKPQYG